MHRTLITVLTLVLLVCSTTQYAQAEKIVAVTEPDLLGPGPIVPRFRRVFTFDPAAPETFSTPLPITGIQLNETILDIDYRPATGELYALTGFSRLYTLNPETGALTYVSTMSTRLRFFETIAAAMAFDPVTDRLRVTKTTFSPYQNLMVNVDTGETVEENGNFRFAAGDPNEGRFGSIGNLAYSRSPTDPNNTTLYAYTGNSLRILNPPSEGVLNTVGQSGIIATSGVFGFDISPATGIAYGVRNDFADDPSCPFCAYVSPLYTFDLTTGAATQIGTIPTGLQISKIAVAPEPTPAVVSFTLIDADTDQPLAGFDPLPAGARLDLAQLPTRNLSIRVNTAPAAVGSVRFIYDGNEDYKVENYLPYAIAGDSNDGTDYLAWTPAVGEHTLTAVPYTEANLGGTAGTALTITFTVEDTAGQ